MMKVFRLYLGNKKYKLKYETYDRDDMYNYVVDKIYGYELTYDPCCNYPSKDKQVELFDKHFREYKWDYISNLLEGYIEAVELNPKNSEKDRETYIKQKLLEHYKEAQEQGYEIFGIFVQGSQNYGLDMYTDEYQSDIDTKCIVLPSLDDIILNKKPISHTYERENKEHIDFKDIRLMWECFTKQNVNFMEILFTDYFVVPDKYKKYWDKMREMAEDIVHAHKSQTVRTMSGMSMEKYKALEHRYPTLIEKIDKYGYDGKQLHHIIRINDFIRRYTAGMSFKDSITPTPYKVKEMQDAKMNKFSLEKARQLAKKYDDDTKEIKDSFIQINGDFVDVEVYNKMNSIKAEIMKSYFVEGLTK